MYSVSWALCSTYCCIVVLKIHTMLKHSKDVCHVSYVIYEVVMYLVSCTVMSMTEM